MIEIGSDKLNSGLTGQRKAELMQLSSIRLTFCAVFRKIPSIHLLSESTPIGSPPQFIRGLFAFPEIRFP